MQKRAIYCVDEQLLGFDINKINECTKECPLECDSMSFDFTISSLTFPTDQMYAKFKADKTYYDGIKSSLDIDLSTYELFKESYLALNIFYPSTQFTKITISPKTSVIDLISNVGGSIGIFLGFSMFSIFEIF